MKRHLTEEQRQIIEVLRQRGADWTADATERHWKSGERYYLDSRNSAGRGLKRAFERGNKQAEGGSHGSQ